MQCIISEWGSNAQTTFYIPPEHYNNNAALTGCSTSALLSIDYFKSLSINDAAAAATATQSIMTCSPDIHPQLNIPVPTIQLPLYYGVYYPLVQCKGLLFDIATKICIIRSKALPT